jgi:putative tricarboxylic transport membrane protein
LDLDQLSLGFSVALSTTNLILCATGALIGTLIGVLPGLGPVATISILLPLTYDISPVGALIMLAGVYYGSQYGGSTTSILLNLPGEASSVITTLDGYQMTRRGRAGAALASAAIGSVIAGCFATLLIGLLAQPISSVALSFGTQEYFALMVLGLVLVVVMSHGDILISLAMVVAGLLLATVGTDFETGVERMTFGSLHMSDGFEFVVIATGVFGITELLNNTQSPEERIVFKGKLPRLWDSLRDLKGSWGAIFRGTAVGTVMGALPGAGAVLASFGAYALEKRIAKDPSRFGKGAIEGVAGPESANNAAAQAAFIPLLTLGIPGTATMALLLGAMTIHGIAPGPEVMVKQPDLFWGLIASMWIGNMMLLVINLPLIGVWIQFLKVPTHVIVPMVVVFCCIGIYSVNNSTFHVMSTGVIGLIAYLIAIQGVSLAPLVLSFVLGPLMETHLRRSLLISEGDPSVFLTRPISATLIIVAVLCLTLAAIPSLNKKRDMLED